ncbi:hypothetical protein MUK42_04530 [Musa troglodytarum]|uniref:Uncharacterized protein n=1 Tax=Musa troglodytarum TaxID=320322 RepID=A0A9E7GH09_9LILI|nr:hypothetical protein MUK42_04530 [Musa troglodytarum]
MRAGGRGPEMAAVPVSLDALASGGFTKLLGPSRLLPPSFPCPDAVTLFLDLVSCQPCSLSWSSFVLACRPGEILTGGVIWFCFPTPDQPSPLPLLSYASLDPITEFCLVFVSFHDIRASSPTPILSDAGSGVCMMNSTWRDEQHPSFFRFIASFLSANSYRLSFLPISPDFIFNNGGLSVAFIFETTWDPDKASVVFSRVERLKTQFRLLYVVIGVPTREQNDSFNRLYFKYGVELGRPTFVPVRDPEMGFEKIVKIAHARGVCKRQDAVGMMRSERERAVQGMDVFLGVVTSIPGIDDHDANAVNAHVLLGQKIIKKQNKLYTP